MNEELLSIVRMSMHIYLFTIVGSVMIWILMCTMLEKKRKNAWIGFVYSLVKSFYSQILAAIILEYYFGEADWYYWLTLANAVTLPLLSCCVTLYCFKDEIIKVLVAAWVSEMIGAMLAEFALVLTNLLEGRADLLTFGKEIQWMDLWIIPIGIFIFCIFYFPSRPLLRRYRDSELRYKKFLGTLFAVYMITGSASYFVNVRDTPSATLIIYFYEIFWVMMVTAVAYVFLRQYRHSVSTQKEYLLLQRELMSSHYTAVRLQIERVDACRAIVNEQMKEIIAIDEKEINSERVDTYLKNLKQEYEMIRAGIYCDDWMVDAVLYCETDRMKRQGIALQCYCQGYDRGLIQETDLAQLLYLLLESEWEIIKGRTRKEKQIGEEELQLGLRITAVKNQLLVVLTDLKEERRTSEKLKRKWLTPYLKKYDGILKTEKGSGEVTILLNRG